MPELTNEEEFIQKLFKLREPPCCILPDKSEVENFAEELLALLFPHFSNKVIYSAEDLEIELELLKRNLYHILKPLEKTMKERARILTGKFFETIPGVHAMALGGKVESHVTKSLQTQKEALQTLGLTPAMLNELNEEMKSGMANFKMLGYPPVIITSATIRPYFYKLINSSFPDIAVLSYTELPADVEVEFIGKLEVEYAN